MSFKKISLKVSRVFQASFNEVLFCNFDVACISSQLPEQKEGLLYIDTCMCIFQNSNLSESMGMLHRR